MAMDNASSRSVGSYRRLLPLLILAAALFLPGSTFAQSVEPNTLTYQLQTGDSLTLYFTLTTTRPLAEVTFENNGLVNDEHTANIPPDKIVITPESQATLEGQQRFAVAIQQPEKPGHFKGDLLIHYNNQSTGATLPITLDVTVQPKPNVAASAASPNQILNLRPNFFYLGACAVAPKALPAGGQIVITLEQNGLGEAELLGLKLDPLRATAQSLPGSVLSVSPVINPTVSGRPAVIRLPKPLTTTAGTADLTVKPDSPCIPPGEYASGLRAVVAGQVEEVVVPFKVRSKSGLLWPLLIAALSLVAGGFSYHLNKKVIPLTKTIQKVAGIQKTLAKPEWLLADEVERFAGSLKDIQDRMTGGAEPLTVEAALDDLATRIKTAQDSNRKFVTDEVGRVKTALDKLTVGDKVAVLVRTTLDEIENRVKTGSYRNLDFARKDLASAEEQQQELQKIAETFEKMKSEAEAEAAKGQTVRGDIQELEDALNSAEDIQALKLRIEDSEYFPEEVSFETPVAQGIREQFTAVTPSYTVFAASLKVQRWIGVGLTALFALTGGLIALYVPNPTWGSSIDDYITLAVWALSVNIIAGQSFDFKAQLKP